MTAHVGVNRLRGGASEYIAIDVFLVARVHYDDVLEDPTWFFIVRALAIQSDLDHLVAECLIELAEANLQLHVGGAGDAVFDTVIEVAILHDYST
jgi:hypothetical protein